MRAEAKLPRGTSHGFDERTWLRRHGIHVVLAGDTWRVLGHRRGLGGFGDRVSRWVARAVGDGLHGERRGVLLGVVLGDEQGLSERLRTDFRASGLYHLLAVSGQNVMLVAGGALMLAWLLGIPRWFGQVGALVAMGGYVLAVGPQPSVLRAGVAGALGSLAWLTARSTDRWYFLLLGGLALLAQADGLCAAYLAGCAKLFGTLPFAQIRSGWAAATLVLVAAGAWAYAWRDGRPDARLPALGHRPAEGGEGGPPAS